MKRSLLFVILLVALLCIPSAVFADSTVTTGRNIRSVGADGGFTDTSAIAGPRTGKAVEVDSRGALSVFQYPKKKASATGLTLSSGTAMVSTACRLSTIIVSGVDTSAGDTVFFYDASSASGTPTLEVTLGVAEETVIINVPGGLTMDTGVFAVSSTTLLHVAIAYDN